jgi:Mg-chelatase subunit ChlD
MKARLGSAAAVLVLVLAPNLCAASMRVALLVDTSSGTSRAITQIRSGIAAFLDALPPEHEVLLVTTGRRTQVRVPPTTDRTKLKDNASGLLAGDGPTPLMDALMEVDDRFMRKANEHWPVFVVVTGDGSESSTATDEKAFNRWIADIAKRGVLANAVVLKVSGNGLPEFIATTVVKATGGHYVVMSNGSAMVETMKKLAEQLTSDAARRP